MSIDTGPFCGCPGCLEPAVAKIDHPDSGEWVVCETHAEGYDVVEEVSE